MKVKKYTFAILLVKLLSFSLKYDRNMMDDIRFFGELRGKCQKHNYYNGANTTLLFSLVELDVNFRNISRPFA